MTTSAGSSDNSSYVIQLSRPEVYVNNISFGGLDAVAVALSTNFIHLVDLEAKKSKQTLDIAKNVVGVHFDLTGNPVLRAVDDSFGIHLFDVRSGSKKKSRLNPIVENHLVTCSAVSNQYIALASSTFVEEKPKKSKKKTAEGDAEDESSSGGEDNEEFDPSECPHVISIFDIRKGTEPVVTFKESHSDQINSLSFFRDGHHLLSGGSDGLVNLFDAAMPKEDDALKSTNQIGSSVSRVGALSKRLYFAITDDNKAELFSPNTFDDIDSLFRRNATTDRFLVDILKGGTEERPVAILECDSEGKLSLLAVSSDGKKSEIVAEWTGHSDIVRSSAYNEGILVTGGEDGKLVVKKIDLRSSGGKANKEKKKKSKFGAEPY